MEELQRVFSFQSSLVNLKSYQDEFNTINMLYKLPAEKYEMYLNVAYQWLDMRNNLSQFGLSQRINDSNRLREEGNVSFKRKRIDNHYDLVTSINLYTQAIIRAPPGETLSLAHANRAMALQEFGLYTQAYDDCVRALQNGYPKRWRQKVLSRQAHCAWQLRDLARLKQHLNELESIPLNDNFQKEVAILKKHLETLLSLSCEKIVHESNAIDSTGFKHQNIVEAPPPIGRHMVAAQHVAKKQEVFTERAASFIPISEHPVCHQCATSLFIPFPCPHCCGRVMYCSIRCAEEHSITHSYECSAYQRNLFAYVGIAHLALRSVLDGLPEMLPHLHRLPHCEVQELWTTAFTRDSKLVKNADAFAYAYTATLSLTSHLHRMPLKDIERFAHMANLLVLYLEKCTNFFKFIATQMSPINDELPKWRIIIGALILRHIGQMISNGHIIYSFLPLKNPESLNCAFLIPDIWARPLHVRRGLLHYFSEYGKVATANFPYLSVCNHSCEPSFEICFNGRSISTIAVKDISKGDQIFNCYTRDFRNSTLEERQRDLKDIYHFECKCHRCKAAQSDAEFVRYHRYRCERQNCRREFVPQSSMLNWWKLEKDEQKYFICTICGENQRSLWYDRYFESLDNIETVSSRQQLFNHIASLDNWMLDYHELKIIMIYQAVEACITNRDILTESLIDEEYTNLVKALKFTIEGTSIRNQFNSIEYISKMTFLWDIIALGKYKCTADEIRSMIVILKMISNDMRVIFMHYYDDYIRPYFKECEVGEFNTIVKKQ